MTELEMIHAWLKKNRVTKCPTAYAAPSQATIPERDKKILRDRIFAELTYKEMHGRQVYGDRVRQAAARRRALKALS